MKNSETDRELKDLIKGTLDGYEEQYILGSWENFVRGRRRKKKLLIWFTGSGIAASLLLGWLGLRFILPGSFNGNAERQQQNTSNLEIPFVNDTLKENKIISRVPAIREGNKKTNENIHYRALDSSGESQGINQTKMELLDSLTIQIASMVTNSGSDSDPYPAGKRPDYYMQDTAIKVLSASSNAERVGAVSEAHRSDTSGYKTVYNPADNITAPENILADNNRSQKFRFGVNVSPGVTSTGTASSFNYSGGVNADYELSRRFRLSSGLQIEHQNVINESSDNPAWIPSGQTQADLVDIDLPLNLTWKFLIRKSACYYLAGGISSVIYLSENYTSTSYTQKMVGTVEMNDGVPNVAYQLENVKSVEQETEAPLSTFDFAGRINIIFGFEQHLSSRVFLHLEPYIKIPVSELATQNLKFTTSGITCKISF
jgi:hypothetical protein